jgi:hypothetical protein
VETLPQLLAYNLGAAVCGAGPPLGLRITFRIRDPARGAGVPTLALVGVLGWRRTSAAFTAVALLVQPPRRVGVPRGGWVGGGGRCSSL